MKEGYYTSSHGHATVLYKIDGGNVEWYLDNVIKSWGKGKFKIIQTDSVMRISLTKLKTSRQGEFENKDFDYSIDISWDKEDNLFKIKDYKFTDNFDMIESLKKRVKSSCKIRAEKPSH